MVCTSASGRRRGAELVEWLHEDEMQSAQRLERLQATVLAAVGDQGNNDTENINMVWLSPKLRIRIKPVDVDLFRKQLFQCIRDCDRRWPNKHFWHSPQGHRVSGAELTAYPVVAKYLNGVHLLPREGYDVWPPGQEWITFPARGGSYSRSTMLQPLCDLLAGKVAHYATTRSGFDDLTLIVYYNTALIYNSPVETPGFTFEDVVATAAHFVGDHTGPFDRIYLFVAVDGGRVLRLC